MLLEHDGEPVALVRRHEAADPRIEQFGYVDQLLDLVAGTPGLGQDLTTARTVLEVSTRWWGTPEHNLTEVVFQPIRSAATRTAALLSGAIDATVEIPIQDIPRIEQNGELQVVQGPELRTIYFGFDHFRDELLYSDVKGKNPFKDRRVRQAIYQAIDVEAIKRSVMRGQSWPAGA